MDGAAVDAVTSTPQRVASARFHHPSFDFLEETSTFLPHFNIISVMVMLCHVFKNFASFYTYLNIKLYFCI